ncbi:hypothetical protein RER_39680 [Rhodococcus erythropolis PR4]|uniref:Uncharacterized protein n=1 Tax=Rhodococcus erythropolis (strain PR4 / NBRC 100887) TaxID=234621 RepID=C1A241_RHOE4|nr:hypothetical protein RER_39680 [Rhodococcus erythropolis PR4]
MHSAKCALQLWPVPHLKALVTPFELKLVQSSLATLMSNQVANNPSVINVGKMPDDLKIDGIAIGANNLPCKWLVIQGLSYVSHRPTVPTRRRPQP